MNNRTNKVMEVIEVLIDKYRNGLINDIEFIGGVHNVSGEYLEERRDELSEMLSDVEDYIY